MLREPKRNDWKNWFTEEDIAFFRPHLAAYMLAYGYPDDWTPAEAPHIRPEHGSEFIQRSVALRRQQDRKSRRQATCKTVRGYRSCFEQTSCELRKGYRVFLRPTPLFSLASSYSVVLAWTRVLIPAGLCRQTS